MTKYIQITKASYANAWYKNRIGMLYPVVESTDTHYQIDLPYSKVHIYKSDCEEVALPTITEQPVCLDGDMGHLHTNKALRDLAHQVAQEYKASTGGNYWEFKEVFWNGCKAMEQVGKPNPAGAHLITTAQADTLVQAVKILEMRGEHSMAAMLRKDFPAVFAPAKTYRVGQRFAKENEVYMMCRTGVNQVCLICLEDGIYYNNPLDVTDDTNITQHEFNLVAGGNGERFTLLPDTTALEEFNDYDNFLPNALKGGRDV
ncbi:hypothetical protein C8N40_11181 [Pontibacter mucosus]|uniref:Uncharacterized protein n=1 Tax=Pontibacter mucosus TaxID=1649266 RepID=A0A2T5YD25_9BACT|nr:hypothetical protein [Pontibacter mucosus]PTX14416.1 hypothetical protein C8N40_11181 [Pontibacter mucosus]